MTAMKAAPEQRMGGRRGGGTGAFSSGGERVGPPKRRGVEDGMGRAEGGASRARGGRKARRTLAGKEEEAAPQEERRPLGGELLNN